MSKCRRSIKDLLCIETEKPALERLYIECDVPTDQLNSNPEILQRITRAFNAATSRNFDSATLYRYMLNRRKAADWPTLGVRRRRLVPIYNELNENQLDALQQIYIQLNETSDEILFSPDLQREIARRYSEVTGDARPGSYLVQVILAKRKHREWERIREIDAPAFSDLGKVERSTETGKRAARKSS